MRTTYITAIFIALLIGGWLLSGQIGKPETKPHPTLAEVNRQQIASAEDKAPTKVRAKVIQASIREKIVKVRGRSENKRTVEVRAETSGRVVNRPVERGDPVQRGDLLCQLSVEDRQATLVEAQAALNQTTIEYEGRLKLKAKGLQSDTAIAQARARMTSAEAQLKRSELDIARTRVRAPFAGIVDDTQLEVGDYVTPGSSCATIVDLDPMLLVGRVSERDVAKIAVGAVATGQLADGQSVKGTVSFVGQRSDDATRTYALEVYVPNLDLKLRSGITADILIATDEVLAQKISPALFALDDEGNIGVRTLTNEFEVEFYLVDVVGEDLDGVWVTGLPTITTIITVGQELVVPGEIVEVNFEPSGEMPAAAPEESAEPDKQSQLPIEQSEISERDDAEEVSPGSVRQLIHANG